MENIKKEDIILENGEIVDFKNLKKIMNSGLEKCVCKIFIEEKLKCGTGFFCNIKQKNMKAIITNNHLIDKEFLNKEKRLNIKIEEEEKEINLELNRYKMTDDNLDYTIIEIIKEDNINNYIDIDENIYIDNYINKQIFCMQYPGGKELKYSHGRINGKKNGLILYSIESGGGSSGSPIILFNNLKVIGLHKGCIYDKNKNKINLGIPINIIIDTINSIKCIYRIKKEDINKDIQIINNGYYNFNEFKECNNEIRNKIKIMIDGEIKLDIMKYKFNKEGEYIIYILEKEKIKDMSCMFYDCKSLKSIDLSNFNTNNVINMSHMFSDCESLESIDLSNFNTNNVSNIYDMFERIDKNYKGITKDKKINNEINTCLII